MNVLVDEQDRSALAQAFHLADKRFERLQLLLFWSYFERGVATLRGNRQQRCEKRSDCLGIRHRLGK